MPHRKRIVHTYSTLKRLQLQPELYDDGRSAGLIISILLLVQ